MDWEKEFYTFLMELICKEGGTRLQMAACDIIVFMQKLPPKHPVNMHRKQYGNLEQCIKACKKPFFIYQDSLFKLKSKTEIDKLNEQGLVPIYQLYLSTYEQVQIKLIEVMRINKQNKCTICGEVYKVMINREGLCGDDDLRQAHKPTYQFEQ